MKLPYQKNIFQIPQAEKILATILPRLAEKRTHSFTSITLSLITFCFLGLFAIGPTISTIADLQRQISDDQQVILALRQKISNLSLLQISYKSIKQDLPLLYDAIPTSPQATNLVGQLQAVAQDAHVSLINIQTLSVDVVTTPSSQYNSFVFALSISGDYKNIEAFLKEISNFNRIVTLDAISLTKPTTQENGYTVSIRGKAYFKS